MNAETTAFLVEHGLWCGPDDCPPAICGGPHREVETTLGVELLREDQQPIGTPLTQADVSDV